MDYGILLNNVFGSFKSKKVLLFFFQEEINIEKHSDLSTVTEKDSGGQPVGYSAVFLSMFSQ